MESFNLTKYCEETINQLKEFQSGDLLSLINIKDYLEAIAKELKKEEKYSYYINLFEDLVLLTIIMGESPEKENEIKIVLLNVLEGFLKFVKEEIEESEIRNKIEDYSKIIKNLLAISKKAEKKQLYSEDYFNNIVNDKKLLLQFVNEAKEHIDEAQYVLIELEYDNKNKELISTIFRNFHTIKGSSAFLGLRNIEQVSHKIEDILSLVRDGKIIFTKELIDVVFIGMELLRSLIDIIEIEEGDVEKIKQSFMKIDIFKFINIMEKIRSQYEIKKIGEILIEEGYATKNDLEKLLEKQKVENKMIGQIAVEEKIITEAQLSDVLKQQQQQRIKIKKSGFVKVSNERLNTLIDLVGELVINQSMLKQEILSSNTSLNISDRNLNQLENITTMIKNIVLSMGMVPIAETFNKLRVVVRNTSEDLGKIVTVETEGEDTELDRNVIETIYDPLIHIVRNAIDHGIESPQDRVKVKKDKVGKIILKAEHKGSGIEITIRDDGKGIDKDKIIKKAIEKGIYTKEDIEKLSEKDIYNILFLPGFSTADTITNLSGRGVGLDVVKKNLDEIHGRVEIKTEKGKFTEFIIKLPMTLAIIEGFVSKVGENKYIFPFNMIEEILVLEKNVLKYSEDKKNAVIFHRNNHIPVIFCYKIFNEKSNIENNDRFISLIMSLDNSKYAIVVDEVIGKQEIVIKSLGNILSSYQYFSGGTIFGDGTIGFVVNIDGLVEKAVNL